MTSRGTTLLELTCLLALLGLGAALFTPAIRGQADLLATRAAREEVVALLHRARAEARRSGRARVVLEEGGDPFLVDGRDRIHRLDLGGRGVRLEVLGRRDSVTLRFGALGIARWGSASFALRRRGASSGIVVSSYGRIRR